MIALYCRVSTAEQAAEGYSIDEQAERLKAFSAAFGDPHVELYVDAGFSGASTDRPALQKLLSDVRAGRVSRVLVYKLDRLSRSQKDTLALIEDEFLAHDCAFVSMSENFDTGTPFGRAMIGVLAVFAQLEREQIKERMSLGKEGRAKSGKWRGGGKIPVGYDYIDGHLIVNDFEALQVREAFERYAGGESIGEIVRAFAEKGYRHKTGAWDRHRVGDVLKNPLYTGRLMWNGETYDGEHDAIIPDGLFERAQAIRARRTGGRNTSKVGRTSTFLGGLIFCAKCGKRYTTHAASTHGKKYVYYTCSGRPGCRNKTFRTSDLDAAVFGEIKKLATDGPVTAVKAPADDRSAIIRAELEKLSEQQSRLVDLYTVDGIDRHDLEKRVAAISEQRERLTAELSAADDRSETVANAMRAASDFSAIIDGGSFAEIRLAVETLINRIEIDGETVRIMWRFL